MTKRTPKQEIQKHQPSTRRANAAEEADIEPYMQWALDLKEGTEHVSYTNFVERFELKDRAHSQQLYSNLIKSTRIKQVRKNRLQKLYTTFLKQNLEDYWADRMLMLERSKTRTHSAIIAARTARITQTASVHEASLGYRSYRGQSKQHKDAARGSPNASETELEGDSYRSDTDSDIPADTDNLHEEVVNADKDHQDGAIASSNCGSSDTPLASQAQRPVTSTPLPSPNASMDHTKRARVTKALPKKKMRLRDPWHDLAEIAVHLFKGKIVDLPPEATKEAERDPERMKLYGLAWRHLRDAKEVLGLQTVDRETCLHFRDAFVALSGVFNLYSLMARKVLSSAECMEAKELCLMPELERKDEELTNLLDSLKTTKARKLTAVLEDVYLWLSSKPAFRLFLLVLRNIIDNILSPHHGDNKPSECDALLIWGSILKDGRPKGSPFTFYLGEQASSATRVSKTKLACALNTGCSARKCDCTLSAGKIQFGNGEAKRASTPPVAVKVQLRKNIKIARSVLLELSKFGLDCPPQLSIYGLQADIFRVMPWKGVYVAAPVCDAIVLPTTEAAWNLFIENSAHRLKNLLEYYHEYAVDAMEKIDAFNYTQNTIGQEEEGEEEEGKNVGNESDLEDKEVEDKDDLDEEIELINWSDVIFHTPTKPRAVRTAAGIHKPNNQRFQQRLQEAVTELNNDFEEDEYDDEYGEKN
ncbi:hypothetical protein BGZ83_009253 [Gryganskiella cystojenkinii]|nr:hypothetical protein BGZ83_009253 [Gryganskiella cystojenkinii]